MKTTQACLAFLLAVLFSSCATLVVGKASQVDLRGKPGTAFETSTGVVGYVPATITIPNGQAVTIQYDSDGDGTLDGTHRSEPVASGSVAGNALMGGIVGLAVDAANPKTRVHRSPQTLGEPYQITLPPKVASDLAANGVEAEDFLDWANYRRSQAEVNLSDKEFSMWTKYKNLIRDQYEKEAQEAIAQARARNQADPQTVLEAAARKAEAERQAQMPEAVR